MLAFQKKEESGGEVKKQIRADRSSPYTKQGLSGKENKNVVGKEEKREVGNAGEYFSFQKNNGKDSDFSFGALEGREWGVTTGGGKKFVVFSNRKDPLKNIKKVKE